MFSPGGPATHRGRIVIIAIRRHSRAREYAVRQPESIAAAVARAMAETLEAMGPIREAAVGLRAQLEADGFSPSAAEYLAVRFVAHHMRHLKLTVSVEAVVEPGNDPRGESGRR